MTPVEREKNDTKVLLAVAGLVVAGATAVALIAGLTAQDDARRAAQAKPVFDARPTPALPVSDGGPTVTGPPDAPLESPVDESDTIEPAADPFVIRPDEDLVARGLEMYGTREFDHAAAYFGAESEARPGRAWTHYMLALSLWKSGRAGEAEVAMEQAAALDEGSVPTFVNLSRIRNDLGDFEGALEASRLALAIDAQDASALFLEGRSLYNLGRVGEALESMTASLAGDPGNPHVQNLLGLALLREGRTEEAVTAFEEAVALAPQVAYMHNNLGMALELSDRPAEALLAYRESVAVDPAHGKAVANLARLAPLVPVEATTAVAESGEEPEADGPVVELAETDEETRDVAVVAAGDGVQ